jgi:glycosyltransferase involved in cell wall biosynthesis
MPNPVSGLAWRPMNLSVILCTYNRAAILAETLRSLESVRQPRGLTWELVLVDNNSRDDTRQIVEVATRRGVLPCRYVFEARQGKAHALNTGVARAQAEVLAFTDDDVIFDPRWLEAVWRPFGDPACLGIGGQILPVWSHLKPAWYSETGPYELMPAIARYTWGLETKPVVQAPWGANMAYRRAAFIQCGGFDPRFGPEGDIRRLGVDIQFGRRVLAGGARVLYVPDAIVHHWVDPARLRKQYFQAFYFQYGRMEVRMYPVPATAVRWFGIPRYLLRRLLVDAMRWATAWTTKRRFFYRLECALMLGKITEAYLTRRSSQEGRELLSLPPPSLPVKR